VLIDKLNNNKAIRPKTMAITFDDGYRDNLLSDLFNLPRVPAYPTFIEMMMELDNFMVFCDYKMKINIFGNQYS
jgi:hypothetical protein